MSTKTELLKEIVTTAGGNVDELPDNLESTLLKALAGAVASGGSGGGAVEPLVITGTEMMSEFAPTDGTRYEDVKNAVDANRPIVIVYDDRTIKNMTIMVRDGVIGFTSHYYHPLFSSFSCSCICFFPDGSVREFHDE